MIKLILSLAIVLLASSIDLQAALFKKKGAITPVVTTKGAPLTTGAGEKKENVSPSTTAATVLDEVGIKAEIVKMALSKGTRDDAEDYLSGLHKFIRDLLNSEQITKLPDKQ